MSFEGIKNFSGVFEETFADKGVIGVQLQQIRRDKVDILPVPVQKLPGLRGGGRIESEGTAGEEQKHGQRQGGQTDRFAHTVLLCLSKT